VAVVLAALACGSTPAAGYEDHAHDPLTVDASLTLAHVVEAALERYPESRVLDARRDQADAWARRGRSWLVDRPSLMLRYQSDRWGSDTNLNEYEAGVELPLWSWGGKRAVKAFGEALTSESEAAALALRWEVAGIVREALWDVALAQNARDLAQQSLGMASQLLATVERRYELGDVALRDVLLSRSSHLEYEAALIDADAALLDAQRVYRSYTGLGRRPDFLAETRSTTQDIAPAHPALSFSNRAVERAEANMALARKMSNAGASVLIATRRERPANGTFLDDSIGVTLNLPFGGRAQRDTQISAAAHTASQAGAARAEQIRQLTLAMHEAAHNLAVVQEQLAAASRRLDIAQRHRAMGESAYEKGEIELLDLLKIRESAITARRRVMQLQIDEKRQTARYNQAVGDLP
jgi:outer membrane protein TolC